jgi:ABC-type branched-subunit amino acid transport system substrate-binding protein
MIPPKWTFSFLPCYEGMVAACAGWIKENWKPDSKVEWIRKHYQKRPPRVSILGWDNPFGRGLDQPELRAYLKKIGVDFIQPEYIPPAPTDTSAELLRLKKAGVDFIYCPMFASAHAVVLKDAQRLGLRDDFVHICWWTSDLWQVQKFAGPVADNCLQLTGWLPLLDEWPKHFRETFQKTGLGMEYSQGYCFGLTAFDWYSDAIRRAIKNVGSAKKLDGEAIYQAVINTNDLKIMGYSCKMSFSRTKCYGPDTGDLYMMQQGKVLRIAKDLYIPDLLPGGRDVPN